MGLGALDLSQINDKPEALSSELPRHTSRPC
jgi:hypothetical protein